MNIEQLNCLSINRSENLQLPVFFCGLDMNLKQFEESGFNSLSSLMIRDDIGQLVVGARGKVFTLNLDDITQKTSEVRPSDLYIPHQKKNKINNTAVNKSAGIGNTYYLNYFSNTTRILYFCTHIKY